MKECNISRGVKCLLGADQKQDGSIVSISKISEVIMSKCSSLMLWNLQLYNNSFEWKKVRFSGGSKHTLTTYIFSGGPDPLQSPRIYALGNMGSRSIGVGFDDREWPRKRTVRGPFSGESPSVSLYQLTSSDQYYLGMWEACLQGSATPSSQGSGDPVSP